MRNSTARDHTLDFNRYGNKELLQAAFNVDREKYPENWEAIQRELKSRGLVDPRNPEARIPTPVTSYTKDHEALFEMIKAPSGAGESNGKYLGFFMLSLGLFWLSQSGFKSLSMAIDFVVAILIHEAGHLAAMKALGYVNLRVFFVPFFGAVAAGESREINSRKNVIVALAGPIVGLLSMSVAAQIYRITGNEIFRSYIVAAVLLNVINLVPVRPLDGGFVFNEIIFARWPWAELGFGLTSLGLIIYFLVHYGHTEPLGIALASIVLIQSFKNFRNSNVALKIRHRYPGIEKKELDPLGVAIVEDQIHIDWPEFKEKFENEPQKKAAFIKHVWNQTQKKFMTSKETLEIILGSSLVIGAIFILARIRL